MHDQVGALDLVLVGVASVCSPPRPRGPDGGASCTTSSATAARWVGHRFVDDIVTVPSRTSDAQAGILRNVDGAARPLSAAPISTQMCSIELLARPLDAKVPVVLVDHVSGRAGYLGDCMHIHSAQ